MLYKSINTPCVGICSTSIAGEVCRGCKRFVHEIISWNALTSNEKQLVWQRLNTLCSQVVSHKLRVENEHLLVKALADNKIRHNPQQSPLCWAYDVLSTFNGPTKVLHEFGITPHLDSTHQTIAQMRDAINDEFYTLSEAYYELHFLRAYNHRSIKEIAMSLIPED